MSKSQDYYNGLMHGLRIGIGEARSWRDASKAVEAKHMSGSVAHMSAESGVRSAEHIMDSIQRALDFYEARHGQKLLQNVEAANASHQS